MNLSFSKIWIIVVLVILAGVALLSYSSLLKIPVFSDIFYSKKIGDLGISVDKEAAKILAQKLNMGNPASLMRPVPSEPVTIEITDVEFTTLIHFMCFSIRPISGPERLPVGSFKQEPSTECPFENFQIKFEKGKYVASAHILEPIEGDVTIFGKVFKKNEKSIDLNFEKVYLGNLPMPATFKKALEESAESKINGVLKESEYLRIDKIEVLDGKIVFEGILPPLPPFWEVGGGNWPKKCEKDTDCGDLSRQRGRDKCVEIEPFCDLGTQECSARVTEVPCSPGERKFDLCGNGICDNEYEKENCLQDCP